LLSAGLGSVPARQTYLDVSQGNRVFDSLYSSELPAFTGDCPKWWKSVEERAESAPADIVPGLLTSTLEDSGVGVRARGEASCTFSARASLTAGGDSPKKLSETPRPHALPATFEVRNATLGQLSSLRRNLHGDDLLIAISTPPPASNRALAVGIAGRGFAGDLTSDSTRLEGYLLSTDVAPTILERFGVGVPSQMSGQAIRGEGEVDVGGVVSLGDRLAAISHRRGPVIGLSLLAWLASLGLAIAVTRGAAARTGVRVAGLAVIYMPLVLLLAAAIEPGESAEVALVLVAAPLLGAVTLGSQGGYRSLAVASALTVAAYAVDVVLGSPLTTLSLLGPNPGLGVRFYGIGNELEALLAVLVLAGSGAAMAGFSPRLPGRTCAIVFVTIGVISTIVFAAGRFGADVGAAIVFPVGVAVAATAIAGRRRRSALPAVAAPFAVLALIAVIDLVSGANAHLTRSVLDAGGLGDLADVAQRRLQLSADSFGRPILLLFLPLVAALAALAVAKRDRLRAWLRAYPAMRAGLLGALAATVAGTLANDSGALLLEIGTAYLLVFTGFAWAERSAADPIQTKSYNSARHSSKLSP
jgi:hypothetical protein